MAEIPKQAEIGSLHQDNQQDHRPGPESRMQRPDGSFLLDIQRLSLLVDGNTAVETGATAGSRIPIFLQKTKSRKFSLGGDKNSAADGDALLSTITVGDGGGRATPSAAAAAASSPPAAATHDKFVTVALAPAPAPAPEATANASPRQPAPCRRAHGRRAAASSPWLDPRRVLLFFAAMSSIGTIILLYFTLSMGNMGDGDANAW